jgi:hypothetical protein
MLLHGPASSSTSCFQLGGATHAAPAGFVPDIRPSGVTRAASAGLLLSIGPSGRRSAAPTGVIPALLRSGQLGLLAPRAIASQSFADPASKAWSPPVGDRGAECGFARALVLRALVGARHAGFLVVALWPDRRGGKR